MYTEYTFFPSSSFIPSILKFPSLSANALKLSVPLFTSTVALGSTVPTSMNVFLFVSVPYLRVTPSLLGAVLSTIEVAISDFGDIFLLGKPFTPATAILYSPSFSTVYS